MDRIHHQEDFNRRNFLAAIGRQCDAVLDLDALADDLRRQLDQTVHERDRAAEHLQQLIASAVQNETGVPAGEGV